MNNRAYTGLVWPYGEKKIQEQSYLTTLVRDTRASQTPYLISRNFGMNLAIC